eukprot:GDKJ01053710.1.p1 GENE.GDKJ01053710.1~~GDKJ01053710.1.p1  ORF type:complete len:385 (+),score=110.28 GDKJ01053710.1:38-1192(+)
MSRPSYMVVAGRTDQRSNILGSLKDRLLRNGLALDVAPLEIPSTLKFGSFDDLIRLADQSSSYDSRIADTFKNVDRVAKDVNVSNEIIVNLGANQRVSHEVHIAHFEWDDTKYPRTRPVRDNVDSLVSSCLKHADEIRSKSYSFTETKNLINKVSAKTGLSYFQADMIDVLVPEVIRPEDLIESEHLTTVVVVVPSNKEKEFLNNYANISKFVAPTSAQKFAVPADRDGNLLYGVSIFKTIIDEFALGLKAMGCMYRKFSYDRDAYDLLCQKRIALEGQRSSEESNLIALCQAALGDIWVSWVHLKGFRAFCEATLRFGVNSPWSAFVIKLPSGGGNDVKVRDALDSIFDGEHNKKAHEDHNIPREFAGDLGGSDNYMTLPLFG